MYIPSLSDVNLFGVFSQIVFNHPVCHGSLLKVVEKGSLSQGLIESGHLLISECQVSGSGVLHETGN
jgi:hypothetical protein